MKSLLLAVSIVALVTPAGARPWAAFYCGKDQIAMIPPKYFMPGREGCEPCDGKVHYFDMKKDPNDERPLPNRLFRQNGAGELFYNGKKCRQFSEKDYDALN